MFSLVKWGQKGRAAKLLEINVIAKQIYNMVVFEEK